MSFRWVAVGIPPGDFGRSRMALCWAAVGMTPGYYSAIVADVVLVDHRVGYSSTPLRSECSNSSGSGSLLRQIVGSAFFGGFSPSLCVYSSKSVAAAISVAIPVSLSTAASGLEVLFPLLLLLVILGLGGGSFP